MPPTRLKKKGTKKKISKDVPLPTNPEELEHYLCMFLTADNEATSRALDVLKYFLETPASIPTMFQCMIGSPRPTSRQLAAVLLCKRIKKHWRRIPAEAATKCRDFILQRLIVEESVDVRRSVAALACIIARIDLPKGKWDTLLQWLTEARKSENPHHRDTCLRILRSLIDSCPTVMAPHFAELREMFESFVRDPNANVRHRALSGLNTLFGSYEEDADYESIKLTIPLLIEVMDLCIQVDDDDSLGVLIDMFTQMIEIDAFDSQIPKVFQNVVGILVNTENIITLRGQASSFVTEYAKAKPGKFSEFSLTPVCVNAVISTLVEEDDNPFDTSDNVPQRLGIEILEVFMQYLPRQTIFTQCIAAVYEFIQTNDLHKRKAAYVLVAMLAEGTTDLLAEYRDGSAFKEIVTQICNALHTESSDLVKMAAGIALTNLCENLSDEMEEIHGIVIEALLSVLESTVVTEVVRRKYVLALDSCCEILRDNIAPYLERIMNQLSVLLQSQDLEVQETAVNALSSTAGSAGINFVPFYGPVVECLVRMVNMPHSEEHVELRSKAICCVSSVAKAVGRANWQGKIEPLIEVVIPLCESEDYSYRDAVLFFMGNMITALGKDTPQLIVKTAFNFCIAIIESVEGLHISEDDEEGANLKGFSDDEEEEPAQGDEEDDDDGPIAGMTMDVGALDEKMSAFSTLSILITTLEDQFAENMFEETFRTLTNVINFPFDSVRKAVMVVFGHLLTLISHKCPGKIVAGQTNPMHSKALEIVHTFIEAVQYDEEVIVVSAAIEQIMQAFHLFGMGVISADQDAFTQSILNIVTEKAPCQVNSDWNDVEAENGEEVLDAVCDLLGVMAQYMGNLMKPFYDQCLPYITKYCSPKRPDNFRSMSIGSIAEVIDFMGASCQDYVENLFEFAIQYLQDSSIDVRRNAAYLAGVLAISGGTIAAPFLPRATEHIMKLIALPEDVTKHTITVMGCRDNAISALAKFIVTNPTTMPLAQFLPVVISGIPLKDDVLEAGKVYPIVCQAFDFAPEIMMNHIPQVVDAFTQVFLQPTLVDNVKTPMVQLLKSLVNKFPNEMQGVVAALPPVQQQAFVEVINA